MKNNDTEVLPVTERIATTKKRARRTLVVIIMGKLDLAALI